MIPSNGCAVSIGQGNESNLAEPQLGETGFVPVPSSGSLAGPPLSSYVVHRRPRQGSTSRPICGTLFFVGIRIHSIYLLHRGIDFALMLAEIMIVLLTISGTLPKAFREISYRNRYFVHDSRACALKPVLTLTLVITLR